MVAPIQISEEVFNGILIVLAILAVIGLWVITKKYWRGMFLE